MVIPTPVYGVYRIRLMGSILVNGLGPWEGLICGFSFFFFSESSVELLGRGLESLTMTVHGAGGADWAGRVEYWWGLITFVG